MVLPVVAFEVAGERYGIAAASVVEVVPAVPLRAVPGTVVGIAGLLRYRGRLVPVIDLGTVWAGRPSPARMSSRIVLCALEDEGGLAVAGSPPRLGVLAERVLRVAIVDPDAVEAADGPATPGAPGLGRLVPDGDSVLQFVRVEELVPADVLASLEGEAEAAP